MLQDVGTRWFKRRAGQRKTSNSEIHWNFSRFSKPHQKTPIGLPHHGHLFFVQDVFEFDLWSWDFGWISSPKSQGLNPDECHYAPWNLAPPTGFQEWWFYTLENLTAGTPTWKVWIQVFRHSLFLSDFFRFHDTMYFNYLFVGDDNENQSLRVLWACVKFLICLFVLFSTKDGNCHVHQASWWWFYHDVFNVRMNVKPAVCLS